MNKLIERPYKSLLHLYFKARNAKPVWEYLNKDARQLLTTHKPELSSLQQRLLSDMKRDGIAVTSLDELFPGKNMLSVLTNYAKEIYREDAEQGKKKYLKKYWDKHPVLNLNNPFLKMTLDPVIMNVANEYMGMWTKLKYYDLAMTLPVPAGSEAVQSQRWHRDPEEKKICKVFVYLNDVDDTAGPFYHVYESNADGRFGKLFPQKTPEGIYMTEEQVLQSIPKENIKSMTGKAGTVMFCDTSGIHKGGYATKNERLMFTGFFASTSYTEKPYFSIPENIKIDELPLTPEAKFAIKH